MLSEGYEMSEDLVIEIMRAEQTTADIHTEAQAQAANIIATAEKEALSIREVALADARKQAQEIVERGSQTAADERDRIIARVRQEINALETEVDANVDAAITYVVRQVLGPK